MESNLAFNQKLISAGLKLVEIHQFDVHEFAPQFRNWVGESVFEDLKHNKSPINEIKTPVIFLINQKLEIDSADLALILEVARQQNLIPLGFINNGKVIADYASFTNLALFDKDYFDSSHHQSRQLSKNEKDQSSDMQKKVDSLNQQLETLKIANAKEKELTKLKLNQFGLQNKGNLDTTSEKFYKKVPRFIEGDISENLKLEEVTFISGNVFLPVKINSKDNLYIFGTCFGQLSVLSEVGQIYIERLRAKRIKISSYHIESSEFESDLIDKSVLFYLANNQIECKIIND